MLLKFGLLFSLILFNILGILITFIKDAIKSIRRVGWILANGMPEAESIAEKNKFLNDSVLQPIFYNLREKYKQLLKIEE